MNRLALSKTTRPLLYGAMGSDHTSLTAFCPCFRDKSRSAVTPTITQSFSVPIQTLAKVCVAVNGEAKCSPVINSDPHY
jgi:hypothetical protein